MEMIFGKFKDGHAFVPCIYFHEWKMTKKDMFGVRKPLKVVLGCKKSGVESFLKDGWEVYFWKVYGIPYILSGHWVRQKNSNTITQDRSTIKMKMKNPSEWGWKYYLW